MILMLVMILVLSLTMLYFRNGRDRRKSRRLYGWTAYHYRYAFHRLGRDRSAADSTTTTSRDTSGKGRLMKIGVVVTVLLILTMLELVIVPGVFA